VCLEVSSVVGRVPTRGFAATGISTRASPALRVRSARVCQRRVCLEVSSVVGRVPTRGFCGDGNIHAGFTRPTKQERRIAWGLLMLSETLLSEGT
jgi:hypothetical protein